jgi:hypothetical protein
MPRTSFVFETAFVVALFFFLSVLGSAPDASEASSALDGDGRPNESVVTSGEAEGSLEGAAVDANEESGDEDGDEDEDDAPEPASGEDPINEEDMNSVFEVHDGSIVTLNELTLDPFISENKYAVVECSFSEILICSFPKFMRPGVSTAATSPQKLPWPRPCPLLVTRTSRTVVASSLIGLALGFLTPTSSQKPQIATASTATRR